MPANPLRGEAELGEFKITIDFDGFCRLEKVTGKRVADLLADFDAGLGFNDLKDWLRVFASPEPSDEQVAALVTGDGVIVGYREALKAFADAMGGFMAKPKEKGENPRKAA